MNSDTDPRRDGPQNGVKGVRADAQRQAEAERDLERMTIDERNRHLESKSFQIQTHDEESRDRVVEQMERLDGKPQRYGQPNEREEDEDKDEDEDEDEDEAFRRQWRERRLQEMKQEIRTSPDETNDDWKLEKHRLREVGPEGFLKAVEGTGWTAVLLYEPDLPRCQPFLQAFLDLSSSTPSTSITFLKARATSLSFSLLPRSEETDREPRSDPDVLPSVLVYREGELKESFIRVDFELEKGEGVDLVNELGRLFRRRVHGFWTLNECGLTL